MMGEVQHSHPKTDTTYQLHSPFYFLVALPAISGRSKSTGEVWMGGAAFWTTAAAVPSRELVDPNARRL